MNSVLERIRHEALDLPEVERKELIHDLIDSLATPADAGAEEAWSAEIRRRIREVEQGTVQCVPYETALANARRAIGCKD
jgi:putative addiction module component (TIGR02574 family)